MRARAHLCPCPTLTLPLPCLHPAHAATPPHIHVPGVPSRTHNACRTVSDDVGASVPHCACIATDHVLRMVLFYKGQLVSPQPMHTVLPAKAFRVGGSTCPCLGAYMSRFDTIKSNPDSVCRKCKIKRKKRRRRNPTSVPEPAAGDDTCVQTAMRRLYRASQHCPALSVRARHRGAAAQHQRRPSRIGS